MNNTPGTINGIYHKSVLVQEVLTTLNPQPGEVYLDATFGGGGHTRAILEAAGCSVIGLDWDQEAIERNSSEIQTAFGERFTMLWGNFAHLHRILKKANIKQVNGFLADFGTSQFQIHQQAGFSFRNDSILDMRMSPAHQKLQARDILNRYSESDIIKVLRDYGEESYAPKIARAIVERRREKPFKTTTELADLVIKIVTGKQANSNTHYKIHPATKTFQALRIEVNNELHNIELFLEAALTFLAPGGRIVCISFHSLEDRMVKNFIKTHGNVLTNLTKKPLSATAEELRDNPSARSAKLRAAQKGEIILKKS